jgi:hypothetical protein
VSGAAVKGGESTSEEVFVRNDVVSLCLMLNRRARTMRVIDFRAGASPAKKLLVQTIARRERIEKVVALVERDECATWGRLGFAREGNIPGFYKRSDAFIMGCLVPAVSAASGNAAAAPKRAHHESGVFSVGRHDLIPSDPSDDDDGDELPPPASSAAAEKTVALARKIAKELADAPTMAVKLAPLAAADVLKRVALATKEGRALTGFEAFGRDITRDDVLASAKGHELLVGAEIQPCYGNAFVEALTPPRDDKERAFLTSALRASCDRLFANGIYTAFAMTPADDVRMATAYVANGFRRTGLLRQHLRMRQGQAEERVDALLWSRKLANPTSDE